MFCPCRVRWSRIELCGLSALSNWRCAIGDQQKKVGRVESKETLRRSRSELRALAAHLDRVREEERAKMARDVHDQLGQVLTALNMDLAWLVNRLPEESAEVREKAVSALASCDTSIEIVRNLARELRPSVLDTLGLDAAVEWAVSQFEKRSGVACELGLTGDVSAIDQGRAITVYRILQEALTNVARHAEAAHAEINLEEIDENLVLRIRDDGRGFVEGLQDGRQSLGLLGMRERAIAWSGEVTIQSAPREGTTVTLRMPVPQ